MYVCMYVCVYVSTSTLLCISPQPRPSPLGVHLHQVPVLPVSEAPGVGPAAPR